MSTAEDLVAATRCTDNREVYRIPVELDAEPTLAFQGARRSERWPLVAIRPAEIQRMLLLGATELIAPNPLRYGQPHPLSKECHLPLTKGSEH
jgi:hypothetical protein